MAVLTFRRGLMCRLCGEVVLEGETMGHRNRWGEVCANRDRGPDRRMSWCRQQTIVLSKTWLHQELRWPVE